MKTTQFFLLLFFSSIIYVSSAQQNKGSVLPRTPLEVKLAELMENPNPSEKIFATKLQEAIALAPNDTLKAKVYRTGARWQIQQGDFHSAYTLLVTAKYYALRGANYSAATAILYDLTNLILNQGLADSCIQIIKANDKVVQASNTKGKVVILSTHASALVKKGEKNEANALFLKALNLSKQLNDTELILMCYANLGQAQSDYDSTVYWYRKVLSYTQEKYKYVYASTLYKIGLAFFERDDVLNDSALYYFLEAYSRIDDFRENSQKSTVANAIGAFFVEKKEPRLALPYLLHAYEYSKNFSSFYTDMCLQSIAVCYLSLNKIDSASYYITEYKNRISSRNDDYEQLLYYDVSASIEATKSDSCSQKVFDLRQRALFHAKQIEEVRIAFGIIGKQTSCLESNTHDKNFSKNANELLEYLAFFKPLINKEYLKEQYSEFLMGYATLAKLTHREHLQVELLEELNAHYAQMRDENYTRGQNEALIKYKVDLNNAEIAYRKRVNLFLIGGVVLLIIIIFITVYYYIRTKTLNTLINAQKAEVEKINKVKDRIFGVISHDLRTPLNSLVSYLNLASIENYPAEKLLSHNALLKKQLFTTTEMMSNLLNWAHSQMQGYKPILETIELKPIADQLIESFYTEATAKNISLQNNIPDQLFVHADMNMTTLIIRNLLSNAIKFTGPSSVVSIAVSQKNAAISIIVTDEGAGLSDDWLQTFNLATNDTFMPSTPGSQNEKGIGIGLMLSKNFAQLMGGTLTAANNTPKGATFTVQFV